MCLWKPYVSLDVRKRELHDRRYGLLPFFLAGMLDVALPGVTIHDGNEHAYYYTAASEYALAAKSIREDARHALADFVPGIGTKYDQHVRIASATYYDYYLLAESFDAWFEGQGKPPFFGKFLSRDDRLRWLQHNLYHALSSCDIYTWWYGESIDWWRGPVDEDVVTAVRAARNCVVNNQTLGLDDELQVALKRARLEAEQVHLRAK
ncbi:MAG: hypothetical protein KatS3mg053_2012 [Candidatus Roseilinea sp.]|nr:MAG: hypothetical protein KatS3mg053_2012 [Candidatus Roseilinea sp.]